MSATYNPSLTTALDRVRFRLDDTIVSPADAAELSDEEINALLASNDDNEAVATLAAANKLVTRYAKMADISVGDTNIQFGSIRDAFQRIVDDIERELNAAGGGALPYAGGISIADKQARESNTDRVEPAFSRDGVGSMGRLPRNRFGEYG